MKDFVKHYEFQGNFPQGENIIASISAQVADTTETAIVQAIIKAASEAGVTDLYLMDRTFILEALTEKVERMKNEPLTIEELRGMDGEPVFVVDTVNGQDSQWCIMYVSDQFEDTGAALVGGSECFSFDLKKYGKTWLAYRRKMEEETP